MKRYNPTEIEPKWQQKWEEDGIYHADEDRSKPKKYILEYFPYPSGAAMHVGHVRNYTIGDALSRYYRMKGYNVMHPMGWDAFGLPAENYAIKNNISPKQAISDNTSKFKKQLMQMGFSYDWSREINSSDPSYYKWTQWFFKLLFDRGLAYQKDSLQWWCDTDKTVLANEQVEGGKCWRCGNQVVKKPLKQWFFKITDYADRLTSDLDKLDWSDSIKSMQKNWIGKSKGAEIGFDVVDHDDVKIEVFTTRPDTLYGVTFMVLAPEHPLVAKITTDEYRQKVDEYIKVTQSKSDVERQETDREKTGVFTGSYAVNPLSGDKIPVWISDYVLYGYGTGAIMAVPAHDERDNAFAKKFNLDIIPVIAQDFGEPLLDVKNVEGVVVIGYDPKTKQYMGLKNGDQGWLVGGGREEGETFDQTARRELHEEAGFTDIEDLIQVGEPVYSYYYNDIKKSNRRSLGYNYLAIIDSTKATSQAQESHEDFNVIWTNFDTLYADIERTGGGVDHWLAALRGAKLVADLYHDGKDFEFECYHGDGVLINSDVYDGAASSEARELIVQHLEREGKGQEKVNHKIRDWLISRQRYWGAPIPIIHCEKDGAVAVPDDQLPVVLPEVESYQPNGEGTSVLAGVENWVNTTCPKCGGPAKRETDTMDGFACSSWYFLRFADPHNDQEPFDADKVKFWAPVDDYIGGAEHAVMHLLYARMWTKVMFDAGLVDFDEPFSVLRNQGMILAPDGRKMSKSWGNVIAPDDIISQGYGADAIRVMELFIAPWNQEAAWSVEGMGGCFRFLQRVWTLTQEFIEATSQLSEQEPYEEDIYRVAHQAIKTITRDLEEMGLNTAVSSLMQFVNQLYKIKANDHFANKKAWAFALESLVQLLAPFAPHIAEELWHNLGHNESVHVSNWPVFDEKYLVSSKARIVVQVNGKVRSQLDVDTGSNQETVSNLAHQDQNVCKYISSREIVREVFVPDKLLNIVIKSEM
jgi:leucyl-tRNA synthetase